MRGCAPGRPPLTLQLRARATLRGRAARATLLRMQRACKTGAPRAPSTSTTCRAHRGACRGRVVGVSRACRGRVGRVVPAASHGRPSRRRGGGGSPCTAWTPPRAPTRRCRAAAAPPPSRRPPLRLAALSSLQREDERHQGVRYCAVYSAPREYERSEGGRVQPNTCRLERWLEHTQTGLPLLDCLSPLDSTSSSAGMRQPRRTR